MFLGQLARVALVLVRATLPAFAAVTVGTACISSAIVWLIYARKSRRKLTFCGGRARQLVVDSWPLIIMAVSIMIYMKIDQVMLTAMAGARENGIYATAVTLSELWYFLPVAVAGTVYPLIVKAHDQDDQRVFQQKLQLFYDAMVVLGYAIAIPVFLLAGPIVRTLYGTAFEASAGVLRVHVVSFIFVCIGVARGQFLVTKNYVRFSMSASLLAAALNVALNLVLIPPLRSLGAAWSTLLSYAAANYVSGLLSRGLWNQTWMLTKALAVPLRPTALWRAAFGR